jgi:hypothetical protein
MEKRPCCWAGCWSSAAAALASWAIITISIVVDDIMMNFNQKVVVFVVVLAR